MVTVTPAVNSKHEQSNELKSDTNGMSARARKREEKAERQRGVLNFGIVNTIVGFVIRSIWFIGIL